jgi:hypothetical protein
VVKKLGAIQVQELDGGWVELGSLWTERPAAIVWLRHYGCFFCREQAAQLRKVAGEAEQLGIRPYRCCTEIRKRPKQRLVEADTGVYRF